MSSLLVSFPFFHRADDLSVPLRARSFEPRPYQITGIEFLRKKGRAILADAPGLGKTFMSTEAAVLPVMVSCPVNLVDQ